MLPTNCVRMRRRHRTRTRRAYMPGGSSTETFLNKSQTNPAISKNRTNSDDCLCRRIAAFWACLCGVHAKEAMQGPLGLFELPTVHQEGPRIHPSIRRHYTCLHDHTKAEQSRARAELTVQTGKLVRFDRKLVKTDQIQISNQRRQFNRFPPVSRSV